MLPPTTVPTRGTIVGSDTPVSSSSSSTLPIFNSSRLKWSDRAYFSSGAFAGKSMRYVIIWSEVSTGHRTDGTDSILKWRNNLFMDDVKLKKIEDHLRIVPLFD
jgi:hypothetical protein